MNSKIQNTITSLQKLGLPPIPVAPAQDPDKYPRVVKAALNQGIGEHCPFNKQALEKGFFQPEPAFTGKNPSYLDRNNKPHLINHREFQDRLPTKTELEKWFTNPANGVGTLGGWGGIWWIDLDRKQFGSQTDCDLACSAIVQKTGDTWLEKTHSGGYRIAVSPKIAPNFTNFSLQPGGKHVGEILGIGRFTVLAPTIGVSGNPYERLSDSDPVEIDSFESLGIFSTRRKNVADSKTISRSTLPTTAVRRIALEDLGNDSSRAILAGENIKGDRSESLTAAIQEWVGWANWCNLNGISFSGSVEDLATSAGEALGIDSDRIERIVKTVDFANCQPAAQHKGGDTACWLKIERLSRLVFDTSCPAQVKKTLEAQTATEQSKAGSKLAANIAKFGAILGTRLQFNQVSGSYEFDGKSTTLEDLEILLALDFDVDIPRGFSAVVKAIAKPYHPVREYLESCYACYGDTTVEILSRIAERYFGCTNPLHELLMRKWLIGVARRVFEPGTKFDTVLTLHGEQGLQKSSWFRVLVNGCFDDSIGSINDKDERIKLHRSWINEWGELEAVFRRKDIALIKSFTTTQIDRLRPPYGHEIVDMHRWSVIVGSTNQDEFLADATGNRRFWVIPVKKRIDLSLLEQERDQIWAAAVALHFQGEPHWLDAEGDQAAAEVIKQYETSDPWENSILSYLDASGRSEVAVEELLSTVLAIELKDQDRRKQMRVADILKRAGWSRTEKRSAHSGQRARLWQRSETDFLVEEPAPNTTIQVKRPNSQSELESATDIALVSRYSTAFKQATQKPSSQAELEQRLIQLLAELKSESDSIRQQIWETLPLNLQRLIQFKILKEHPNLTRQAASAREVS